MASGIPAWLYPDTDQIASFAPFNNQPTQYRILVEGKPRGFAQCGFESLAVCWLFPGQDVTIEAPCLDCGEPIRLTLRDGKIRTREPADIVTFVDVPFKHWRDNLAYS
jgi:Alkylmercury lyase